LAFSEATKLIVRKKSHLQCCLCKHVGIEIHHIIPQSEGGPDDESNAAPLCPACHEIYGDNPKKRKFITEARNLWYEICESRYRVDGKEIMDIKNTIKTLPTSDTLLDIKDQIISALKSDPKITDIIGVTSDDSVSEILKELDIYDLITYFIHSAAIRDDKNKELILMPDLWPEEDGHAELLSEFTDKFGKLTLYAIVDGIINELGIPENKGLTTAETVEILHQASIKMTLLIFVFNGELMAGLNENGEIMWWKNETSV